MTRTHSTSQPQTTAQQLGSLIKSARDIMRKDKGLNGDLDRLPQLTWIMFLKFLDDMEQMAEVEAQLNHAAFRPAIAAPYRWRDWATGGQGITGDDLLAFVGQDEAMRPDGQRGPGLLAYLRSRWNRRRAAGASFCLATCPAPSTRPPAVPFTRAVLPKRGRFAKSRSRLFFKSTSSKWRAGCTTICPFLLPPPGQPRRR